MTKEMIKSPDGRSYMLNYDGQLTPEQRLLVLNEIERSTYEFVTSLATCTSTQKQATQVVALSSSPTNGQPPYTVKFYKGNPTTGTLLYTSPPVSAGGSATYNYTLTGADVGTPQFSVVVTDSCPTGSMTCTDSCTVTVITSICSYISNLGGPTYVKAATINALITNYATGSLGFTTTATNLNGAILYYAGAKSNGNTATGCNF